MWEKTLINPDTTILKTIETIDQAGLQIALVVNEEGQLLGTVTDGDIRRAIMKHLSLDEPVSKIMSSKPSFVFRDQPRESAALLMKNRKIRHVPIVDEDLRLMGLEIADEILNPPPRENWVILMAGGMGQRLRPLTEACPKPLLKVGGKPLLETILESFIEQGFRHFYISVNYKAEMIMEYFKDGSKWEVEIKYLQESRLLGTAGAMGLLPALPREPLIVMNGDILTKINYVQLLEFHHKNGTDATICVKEQYSQIPYGVVALDKNRLRRIDEKPFHSYFINSGLYVFNPAVLDYVPAGPYFDIPDLVEILLKNDKEIAVFPIREYWIDIGRMDDYERANLEYAEFFK
jgi:Nucleoside-diphosphate-sugar pyrophosphorylase involved in lipopolysaccharide biosynthesis/translation initiation factor 2B, gamma/epsilon subunits (eIF-2Bgamma/eIF-2Bepsilon)